MPTKDKQAIEYFLNRGVEKVYPNKVSFEKALNSGKKLTIYLGIDPTGPNLHFGHMIVLEKLRQWQVLGHQVNLLIGDFTGMVGDPTDKSAARKQLTAAQVKANAKKYKEQASKLINFKGKNAAKLLYNSKWLSKLNFNQLLELATNFTVQQLLERDMFENRMKEGKPIYLHEFMYPLMQGYDSVAMDVDAEVGGNDQTYNMLAGRDLLKALKKKEKFVMTMKLLTDSSGVKAGKTTGNIVSLDAKPEDMFGSIMSWVDDLIVPGFELLTLVPDEEIKKIEKEIKGGANPKDYKIQLAHDIVSRLHSKTAADKAESHFKNLFQKKEVPTDMPTFTAKSAAAIDVLVDSGLAQTKSEARRLIEQGGIKIDGKAIKDIKHKFKAGDYVLQRGKRQFIKLMVK